MGNSIVIRGDEAVPAGGEGKPDIIESRGERVVLDADLASLFGVETRVLETWHLGDLLDVGQVANVEQHVLDRRYVTHGEPPDAKKPFFPSCVTKENGR